MAESSFSIQLVNEESEIEVSCNMSSSESNDEKVDKKDLKKIRVKVFDMGVDVEIYFRVNPTMKLGRLMNAYSNRIGVSTDLLRFLFDGRRINDNTTAIDLEMVDNDVIEVFREQDGTTREDGYQDYPFVQMGKPPLNPSIIRRIPTGLISEAQAAAKISCSICLEYFSVGQEMKELECCHMFHVPCIEKWLKIQGTCPVCRQVPNPVNFQANLYVQPLSQAPGGPPPQEERGRRRIRERWEMAAPTE